MLLLHFQALSIEELQKKICVTTGKEALLNLHEILAGINYFTFIKRLHTYIFNYAMQDILHKCKHTKSRYKSINALGYVILKYSNYTYFEKHNSLFRYSSYLQEYDWKLL